MGRISHTNLKIRRAISGIVTSKSHIELVILSRETESFWVTRLTTRGALANVQYLTNLTHVFLDGVRWNWLKLVTSTETGHHGGVPWPMQGGVPCPKLANIPVTFQVCQVVLQCILMYIIDHKHPSILRNIELASKHWDLCPGMYHSMYLGFGVSVWNAPIFLEYIHPYSRSS